MSAELLQVQEQLQRARDNLRHVEEGIKRTSVSSSHRFGDGGGRVAVGRRLGGMAGVQRFREEAEAEDEPPLKKSLSSVASRLGPILTGKKDTEEIDSESPAVKSTVTSTLVQNRENASSVASDTKTLDRSKRLFGSLLMGTLRQFKHDKETRKQGDIKQAEVLERVEKKEQEALAKTQQDRDKLVDAKDGVKDEIRLLEMQMELAELKVRAVEERDMLAQFIKTSTKPALYYTPKEHNHRTEKVLKDSNHRVNKIYEERISKLNKELGEVKRKLQQKKPIDERIGELSTIKLENLTKTIVNNDNSEKEEKTNNPITGIKVEVKLRESEDTVVKSESEDEVQQANGHVDEKSEKNNSLVNEKAGKTISRRSQSPRRNDRSPRRRSSPRRRRSRSRSAPRRRRSSPRSEHRRSEGARRSRSPRRRSSPKSRKSASPKNRKLSRSKSPAKRNSSQTAKSPEHPKPKSPTKKESSRDTKSASPKKASKSQSKSRRSSSSADSSSDDDKQSNKKKSDREKGGSSGNSSDGSESD